MPETTKSHLGLAPHEVSRAATKRSQASAVGYAPFFTMWCGPLFAYFACVVSLVPLGGCDRDNTRGRRRPEVDQAATPTAAIADVQFLTKPSFRFPRPETAPLSGLVAFESSRAASATLEIGTGEEPPRTVAFTQPHTEHSLPVLGLRPDRTYQARVRLHVDGQEAAASEPFQFETGPLPSDFPTIAVAVSEPERMEPGVTVFNAIQWTRDLQRVKQGWLIALDAAGDVVWLYHTDHVIFDVRRISNGRLVYTGGREFRTVTEIDMLGNVTRRWHAVGRDPDYSGEAIPVETNSLHHDFVEMPNGHFLTLSTDMRRLEKFPSGSGPDDWVYDVNVIGDVILELQADGTIVRSWNLFDVLDPMRIRFGALSPFWDTRGYDDVEDGTNDWTHTNSVVYDPSDDAVIASVRHQDAVIKIDCDSGELVWILGVPYGWRSPWQEKRLKSVGGLELPYHQHAVEITPHGTLLMYDNGNYRPNAAGNPTPAPANSSRALEVRVDEEEMTVAKVWEYRGTGADRFYSPFLCDADWMPTTGNVLVTDGGRVADENGNWVTKVPGAQQWARILEVTHTSAPEIVFEITLDDRAGRPDFGWSIYRSERLQGLYPQTN